MVLRRNAWLVVLATLVAVLSSATVAPVQSASAQAGSAQAGSAQGRVRGAIVVKGGDTIKVKMRWFTAGWDYLGARRTTGGGYSISLEPGLYYLQFADMAPNYDVHKRRPATVKVRVRAGSTTIKNVRMLPGAAIGGTVMAGGKVAGGARVVAASADEQSFETTADKSGRFALGGLPPASYSVFTYDKAKKYVAKSLYLPKLKGGSYQSASIKLNKRAGNFLVDLYAGSRRYPGRASVTAVSKTTGQFWTAKSAHGSVTFEGLYPGRYVLQVPGVGGYLDARVLAKGSVRSGTIRFSSVRLTKQGGSVGGTVVDANDPSYPLAGASVRLFDAAGNEVANATTADNGTFVLNGPLRTQQGMTVVAAPASTSPYLGEGTHYCRYGRASVTPVAITTGRRTTVGTVALPHLADSQQDGAQCYTPTGRLSR